MFPTSASRMRLTWPPKSASQSNSRVPLGRHSLTTALEPPNVSSPADPYPIALWITLLSGSSNVRCCHFPPLRVRIPTAPGRVLGVPSPFSPTTARARTRERSTGGDVLAARSREQPASKSAPATRMEPAMKSVFLVIIILVMQQQMRGTCVQPIDLQLKRQKKTCGEELLTPKC